MRQLDNWETVAFNRCEPSLGVNTPIVSSAALRNVPSVVKMVSLGRAVFWWETARFFNIGPFPWQLAARAKQNSILKLRTFKLS